MKKTDDLADRTASDFPAARGKPEQGARRGITRRHAGLLLGSVAASAFGFALPVAGYSLLGGPSSGRSIPVQSITPEAGRALFDEAVDSVLPKAGFRSRVALKDSILRLVAEGVIDPERFASIYEDRGGIPAELAHRLKWPSHLPIHLTAENAGYYVNLLWPVGLANGMSSNEASPVNGPSLFTFASTSGWNVGKEENGGAYFNRFRIVDLTPEHEEMVTRVAESTFRPCCNNSTFFQDCNHGSALLGLLQLGASQGLTDEQLYEEALAFNSFWFPETYVQTAVYFRLFEDRHWADLDPKMLMGARYSALGPWQAAVGEKLAAIPGLLPAQDDGVSCGA